MCWQLFTNCEVYCSPKEHSSIFLIIVLSSRSLFRTFTQLVWPKMTRLASIVAYFSFIFLLAQRPCLAEAHFYNQIAVAQTLTVRLYFLGCGDCTCLPTGPPPERQTSCRCCQPGKTGMIVTKSIQCQGRCSCSVFLFPVLNLWFGADQISL